MPEFATVFYKNKYFLSVSALALALNLIAWLWVFFHFSDKNINIILYYDILFGVGYQGLARELFTIPIIGLLIFIINFAIIRFVYQKEKFIFYLLLAASLVSQIFVIIAIAAIILVNSKNLY